jgi:hypothetical protein
MTAGDLLKMCTSSDEGDKTACTFYILGVTEGAELAANVVKDSSGVFRELKDKPICVPENLSSKALELVVRMSIGEDLAVFPQDRDGSAVSFVSAVIRTKFPCRKPNKNQELGAKLNNVEKENQELTAKLNGVTKGASLELQKKCADQSASEFKTWGWNKKPLAGYDNHYQQNLNKCFVRIENSEFTNNVPATSITVSDAYEGKVYGDYQWINTEGKKYWEVKPFICKVTLLSGEQKFCHSKEEFDELVKVYMEQ